MTGLTDHEDVRKADAEIESIEAEQREYLERTGTLMTQFAADLKQWSEHDLAEALRTEKQPPPKPTSPIDPEERTAQAATFAHRLRMAQQRKQETIARLAPLFEAEAERQTGELVDRARRLMKDLDDVAGRLNRLNGDLHHVRMARFTVDVATGGGGVRPEKPNTLTPATLTDMLEHGRPVWQAPPRQLGFTTPVGGDIRGFPTGPEASEPTA
jgi:hypothetical protein